MIYAKGNLFILDSEEDLAQLPTNRSPGARAKIVGDSSFYILNSQGQWIAQTSAGISEFIEQIGDLDQLSTQAKDNIVNAINELALEIAGMANGVIIKGSIGPEGTIQTLPPVHIIGEMYKVIETGIYAGQVCEVGDVIICIQDGTSDSDEDWIVIQGNTDRVVSNLTSASVGNVPKFSDTSGIMIEDSGYTIASNVPSNAKFTDTTYDLTAESNTTSGVDISLSDGETPDKVNIDGGQGINVKYEDDKIKISNTGVIAIVTNISDTGAITAITANGNWDSSLDCQEVTLFFNQHFTIEKNSVLTLSIDESEAYPILLNNTPASNMIFSLYGAMIGDGSSQIVICGNKCSLDLLFLTNTFSIKSMSEVNITNISGGAGMANKDTEGNALTSYFHDASFDANTNKITFLNGTDTTAKELTISTIGTLSDLYTTAKADIVSAINEVDNGLGAISSTVSAIGQAIGDPSNLDTTNKSNYVAAINEVNTNADTANTNIGTLSNLTTTDKDNLVEAINEVDADITLINGDINDINTNIGTLADLNTVSKDSLVDAINDVAIVTSDNTSLTGTQSITLTDQADNRLGEVTALTVTLPASTTGDYISGFAFTSGETATSIDYPDTIKWVNGSTDVIDSIFVPLANTRYTVVVWNDGVNVCGTIGGVAIESSST